MLRIIGGIVMIDLQEKTLQSFLYKTKEKAVQARKALFISWSEKIAPVVMIDVFNAAKNKGKQRQFWTNGNKDFSIVGIGTTKTIIASDDQIHTLQQQWDTFVQDAIIYDPYETVGTGAIALGGMDFDSKKQRTTLWEKYETSALMVPEMTVVHHENNYYVTFQIEMNETTNIAEVLLRIEEMKQYLQPASLKKVSGQKIVAEKEIAPNEWKQSVQDAVDAIKRGEAKKIVLAREMRVQLNQRANIAWMLHRLMETQPNSYVFAFEKEDDNCFIGATPERLVQVEGDELLSTCLAGTAPRGKTEAEDKQIAQDLLEDPKNREEHHYVVQMIRDSIEDDCETVHIPNEPTVWTLRNLHHLFTPVTATLKANRSIFNTVEKLHPTPALGGLPKEAALTYIREHERLDRGWYGAPVGWVDSNHNGEFAVAIRSGLVQGEEISLFAGCGVMRDSDPQMEYEETGVKFLPMYNVLEDCE